MRFLLGILWVLFCVFQYHFWFGESGLSDYWKLKQNMTQQKERNESLKQRNQALAEKIQTLKTEKNAIETLAREQLGLIKNGETYYRLVK